MLVKKSLINYINNKFLGKIKELIIINYGKDISLEKHVLCSMKILNKKVEFVLNYLQIEEENCYWVEGSYTPNIKHNRKCVINITINLHRELGFEFFQEIYFRIKSVLIHEIEHHLQHLNAPFREKIDLNAYSGNTIDYINSPAEMESFTKEYYFLSKKTGINFTKIVDKYSDLMCLGENEQKLFKLRLYKYIKQRKDLNILNNLNL